MNKVWNEVERDFVRQHVEQLSDEQGAAKLSQQVGRAISTFSYRKQRQKMGLAKQQGRGINRLRVQGGEQGGAV